MTNFLALLPFYFLGTFPTGLLLAKFKGVDLVGQGSGNVGATNVTRIMGRGLGLLTLAIDTAKGFFAVLIAAAISDSSTFAAFAGVASVAGHCFSIPGRLKGGKGVATSLGVILAIKASIAAIAMGIFILVCAASRLVSLASLVAAACVPIIFMLLGQPDEITLAAALLAAIIIVRHRQNILRIIAGSESRLGKVENGVEHRL